VNITLSVEEPQSLGSSSDDLASVLYQLADETGLPPQMIMGQVIGESNGNPMAWRYEPLNAPNGDIGYSTHFQYVGRKGVNQGEDYRTNAQYGAAYRLPTIGDSVDPGNCAEIAVDLIAGNNKIGDRFNGGGKLQITVNKQSYIYTAAANGKDTWTTLMNDINSSAIGTANANGVTASWADTAGPNGLAGLLLTDNNLSINYPIVVDYAGGTALTDTANSYPVVANNTSDYARHVDSRIINTICAGIPQGPNFSQQVLSDSMVNPGAPGLRIPKRDPSTGVELTDTNGKTLYRPLAPSDRYVSARDILNANLEMRWKEAANSDALTALTNGTVAYSAQLSLAASYGYLQITYFAALGADEYGGDWTGNDASCDAPGLQDPDNLFDTTCNLESGGGSLRMGTRITAKHFASPAIAKSTSPSVPDESKLEGLFSRAYQRYDSGKKGYGANVIATSKTVEPNPTGAIFTTGGQQ
jgi:hypothetical protein